VAVAAALVAVLPFAGVAFGEDSTEVDRRTALIGEQFGMRLLVLAPEGATVEIAPGTETWVGVELINLQQPRVVKQSDGDLWIFEAVVSPFLPGEFEFAPTVTIVQGGEATIRVLPGVPMTVSNTLAPDAALELTPLAPATEISGAESPLLRPALIGGGVAGSAILAVVLWFVGRLVWRRLSRRDPSLAAPHLASNLDGAEELLDADPVGAYRLMSSLVKTELAKRYNLRATALTTTELRRRLEHDGKDRWEARLVGGLLEECDAVIYAGYRPAAERRRADLNMAREIVEVAS